VGQKSGEQTALHHALNRAYRKAQHFGGLAGADVSLFVLVGFHALCRLGPEMGGKVGLALFGC
jgi:hypothetical protein